MKKPVILCWSTGKDSAWSLNVLNQDPDYEVVALLSTITEDYDRVSMHGVRVSLLEKQAESTGLPLWKVKIPAVCTNEIYEKQMGKAVARARKQSIQHMAFGDLYLQDIRDYRCSKLAGTGIEPIFPLWEMPTRELAETMLSAGLKATLTCVDTKKLAPEFSGRSYSAELLADLPQSVDPCGENGEFHSFCHDGPMFKSPINITVGDSTLREGFCFTDLT